MVCEAIAAYFTTIFPKEDVCVEIMSDENHLSERESLERVNNGHFDLFFYTTESYKAKPQKGKASHRCDRKL